MVLNANYTRAFKIMEEIRSTKKNTEKPKSVCMEQAWNGLYSAATTD